MAIITPNPFTLGDSLLTIGVDDYQAAVSSVSVTSSTGTATFNGLAPGANFSVPTTTTRSVEITAAQDWSPTGISRYFWDNAGTEVTILFEPVNGAEGFSIVATLVEPSIGGTSDAVAEFTVSLPIKGKPTLIPAA